jgi:glycerophosphoryl diester phosphodiesterase
VHPLLSLDARPVIAHRGASADAPENTLEALALAVAQGADVIEVDVRLTRDGVPVLLHDPTLDRTTDRAGEVARLTLEEVRAADAGARFHGADGDSWRGRGVRVPTLAEALDAVRDTPILLELKVAEAQGPVARLLRERGEVERCAVASFRRGALRAFAGGQFLVGSSRPDVALLLALTRLRLPTPRPRARFLAVPWRWKNRIEVPRRRFVAAARRHGRPVHVWTVDDAEVARLLWGRGVSGIITNRPASMREVRAAAGRPRGDGPAAHRADAESR